MNDVDPNVDVNVDVEGSDDSGNASAQILTPFITFFAGIVL